MSLNTMTNAAKWVARYRDGENLSDIARSYGVSRERIRQVLCDQGRMDDIQHLREVKRQERLDTEEAHRQAALAERRLKVSPQPSVKRYTDEDIVNAVHDWIMETGSTSAAEYTTYAREHGLPSAILITQRLGWGAAVRAAGFIMPPPAGHRKDRIPDAEVLLWVIRFLTDPEETRGGANTYDGWQKKHAGAPSLATVRNHFGQWTTAKQIAVDMLADEELRTGLVLV